MTTAFLYDGHRCQIEETEHGGCALFDGFVDGEQICRDQPAEALARRAAVGKVFLNVPANQSKDPGTKSGHFGVWPLAEWVPWAGSKISEVGMVVLVVHKVA
jgi:hypothetical protein